MTVIFLFKFFYFFITSLIFTLLSSLHVFSLCLFFLFSSRVSPVILWLCLMFSSPTILLFVKNHRMFRSTTNCIFMFIITCMFMYIITYMFIDITSCILRFTTKCLFRSTTAITISKWEWFLNENDFQIRSIFQIRDFL